MTTVLFLCSHNSCRSQMAEGFARARNPAEVTIFGAGTEASYVDPRAIKVMKEVGLDISEQTSKSLEEIDVNSVDICITLCDQASQECPVLPGNPATVNWSIRDPEDAGGTDDEILEEFRAVRDVIKSLVDDLFDRGYLTALLHVKDCSSLILNNITDGIVAHDINRRIFHFNRAAEEITGYSRKEVINRDCHEVLPGGLCAGRCQFPDCATAAPRKAKEQMVITTKNGESRFVERVLKEMTDPDGNVVGALMSFRDLTRERALAKRVGEIEQFSGIIGRDEQMLDVFELITDLADSSVPVFVQGESGTGKELVAAAIHNEGPRANNLFVPVNCGALPESLLESELFGHVKGAFTGAIRDKKGRFELADGGTIFLDEIGDISQAMQVKLLRVLQEGRFERVGSESTISVNVRIISATNKDIQTEIMSGNFREDLYYRLSVVPVTLPPLRDRRNDIPLLVEHTMRRIAKVAGKEGVTVSAEAQDIMMSYDWPGNVRELENWLQFALVKCRKETVILPEHLPPTAHIGGVRPKRRRRRRKLSIEVVRAALRDVSGNKVEAAKELGVSRATLYRFLNDAGLLD